MLSNNKYNILKNKPQFKSIVIKIRIQTPRKPNSARRPVAKSIVKSKKYIVVHIPGIGHNLRKHSSILTIPKGARDLPGVSFSAIRGKYDLSFVLNRNNKRSKYGIPRPDYKILKLRRKLRIS